MYNRTTHILKANQSEHLIKGISIIQKRNLHNEEIGE